VKKYEKVLSSVLVAGALCGATTFGVFGAFSATTQNAGNEINTGTVVIGDNDAGQSMFNITDATPSESWSRCIKVTYTGSLDSDVRQYLTGTGGVLTPYLRIKVEQGTSTATTFPSCAGFVPDPVSGQVADNAAPGAVPTLDWSSGVALSPDGVAPNGPVPFARGDSVAVRITASLDPAMPDSFQGASTGSTSILFEARNR
jgi:hypothetical protein